MGDLNLKKMFKEKKQDVTGWVSFADGFDLLLAYVPPAEMRRMLKKCQVVKVIKGKSVEQLDDEVFRDLMAEKILDWRLTLGVVADLCGIEADDPAAEVPCTEANKVSMLDNVYGLPEFIRQNIMDAAALRGARQEVLEKNSGPTPGNA